jgi:hypothetical protein
MFSQTCSFESPSRRLLENFLTDRAVRSQTELYLRISTLLSKCALTRGQTMAYAQTLLNFSEALAQQKGRYPVLAFWARMAFRVSFCKPTIALAMGLSLFKLCTPHGLYIRVRWRLMSFEMAPLKEVDSQFLRYEMDCHAYEQLKADWWQGAVSV